MKKKKQKMTTKEFMVMVVIALIIWRAPLLIWDLGIIVSGLLPVIGFGIGALVVSFLRKINKQNKKEEKHILEFGHKKRIDVSSTFKIIGYFLILIVSLVVGAYFAGLSIKLSFYLFIALTFMIILYFGLYVLIHNYFIKFGKKSFLYNIAIASFIIVFRIK